MRLGFLLSWPLLASLAPAQRFGFTHRMVPAGTDLTEVVTLGDVDGDGDLDAYLGSGLPGGLGGEDSLFLNAGGGFFSDVTATNLPAPPYSPMESQDVELGDIDGDGDLDVLIGNGSLVSGLLAGPSRLYLNGSGGVFADATAANLPGAPFTTQGVALGDVDGDGDLDGLMGGLDVRLFQNGGAGIFADVTATNLPPPFEPHFTGDVALGDLDGDGDLDAYLGNWGGFVGNPDRLYLNDGSGAFTDSRETDQPVSLSQAVALGDVDGDGDLDALVGRVGPSVLLFGDGSGVFTDASATNLPFFAGSIQAVAFGDVDGDGDLDAFLCALAQNRLYQNDGSGLFTNVTGASLPLLPGGASSIALGDVDGDGDLDVLFGDAAERMYLNNGAGVYADVSGSNLPALLEYTGGLALGDVDGDGDLDAFLGNWGFLSGQQDRLYVNDGSGVFTDATAGNLPVDSDSAVAVALGDMDGDGDLDAFVGNASPNPAGEQNRLHLNDGTGTFADVTATNVPPPAGPTRDVALGDLDEDGDLDAFVASGYDQNRLHLNNGSAVLLDATSSDLPILSEDTVAVALGDVDGDRDLDTFAAVGLARSRVYVNRTRQLAWRGIPRAGKPLTLEVLGPSNGTWLLAAAAQPGNLPIPPFGSLRLELPTLFIVAGGILDPQGLASLTFPVPANPSLIGGSLFWQALVGPPLRFTNLEITTVTNL